MNKILYDTGNMDAENNGEVIIRKTEKGISVERLSLYTDKKDTVTYYDKFPKLPKDWDAQIEGNEGTTEFQYFMYNLGNFEPYHTKY